MVAPFYCYMGQVASRFGTSGSLEEWKWHYNIAIDANTHLRPLHRYILEIYKCVKHWYAVSSAYVAPLYCYTRKVGPCFCPSESLEEWKRRHNVTIKVNTNRRPLHTSIWDIYTKCFKHWYAVSSAYCCTLILLHGQSWPQIWYVRVAWGVIMTS